MSGKGFAIGAVAPGLSMQKVINRLPSKPGAIGALLRVESTALSKPAVMGVTGVAGSALSPVKIRAGSRLSMATLLLFSRSCCCLCEGLEEKLRALQPPPHLHVRDVDADPALQARYGLEVPVLALERPDGDWQELPRVPPRLAGAGLAAWLARHGIAA
jgi:hypothetical protein